MSDDGERRMFNTNGEVIAIAVWRFERESEVNNRTLLNRLRLDRPATKL